MEVGWSDLPQQLLISIADRLVSFEDMAVFGSVCSSWRRAAAPAKEAFDASRPQQLPWLMTILKDRDDSPAAASRLVEMDSLARRKTYRLPQLPHQLARNDAKAVLSSLGWIFTSYSNYEARLFHPLTGTEIVPPNLSTNNISAGIIKFVLSASPSRTSNPEGYKAIIIHDDENEVMRKHSLGHMAFWEAGDAAWTTLETKDTHSSTLFADMVYRDGRVFAVDLYLRVQIFNIDEKGSDGFKPRKVVTVAAVLWTKAIWKLMVPYYDSMVYVAELDGAVLVVQAERPLCSHRPTETVTFRVYEWRGWEGGGGAPHQILSLRGSALFLCQNSSSFAVKASDYDGCEADCIYFADDFRQLSNSVVSDSDVGIFRLRDGSSDRSFRVGTRGCLFPPLWLQPTFS